MCAVSMVYDRFGTGGPNPPPYVWPQTLPSTLPWTPDAFAELKEIIKRLDALDKKLGLAECEDPKKAKWMATIEKRLKKLERTP